MEMTEAVRALAALSHPRRLEVFRMLVQAGPEGCAAGDIGGRLDLAPATLSFHLKELAGAGLIAARPEARFIYYSASYESMAALIAYLTENCCRGMPEQCLATIGNAVQQCCSPPRKSAKKSSFRA